MVKEIVDRLRSERIKQRMTMKELATKSRVSVKHICDIENSNTTPTIDTLQKLANGLGLEINFKVSDLDDHLKASSQ